MSDAIRIAAVTMARNDSFFLSRWIRYYGREVGYDHLYIYLDGEDQEIPPGTPEEVHITKLPHRSLSRSAGDKYRIGLLTRLAHRLLNEGYDLILGTDSDEFVVPDPRTGLSLREYLSEHRPESHASALGLDLGQRLDEEAPLDPDHSLLDQRRYAVLTARYTKSCILTRPLDWGSGFHRVRGHNLHILPDLYLIHAGYCDLEMVKARQGERGVDWGNHLSRRARTIHFTSTRTPIDADRILRRARRLQTLFRPLFAWNKPLMPGRKRVVRLPERFRSIDI